MMEPTTAPITVSAPGKVLLCGGYLVLEQPNAGLVLAFSSRFYCSVQWEKRRPCALTDKEAGPVPLVVVKSRQFHKEYVYWVEAGDGQDQPWRLWPVADDVAAADRNGMVEWSVLHALLLSAHCLGGWDSMAKLWRVGERQLCVALKADNDFYSQAQHLADRNLPRTLEGLACLPPFLPCPTRDGEPVIHKTGLGSSAALVTSLVGALLAHFRVCRPPSGHEDEGDPKEGGVVYAGGERGLGVLHRLAQACHALAQGKVGSGFDVSSAVYGSQIYSRFSPSVLQPVLSPPLPPPPRTSSPPAPPEEGGQAALTSVPPQALVRCVLGGGGGGHHHGLDEDGWDDVHHPFELPPGMSVMLGDVAGGSSTPAMVKKVLQWRQQQQAKAGSGSSPDLWSSLGRTNDRLRSLFRCLSRLAATSPHSYTAAISRLSGVPGEGWACVGFEKHEHEAEQVADVVMGLRRSFLEARGLLRSMGEAAGVEVEPPAQTQLADATMQVPGVLAAGVPGAGGVDAVFALLLHDQARQAVADLWATWHHQEQQQGAEGQAPGTQVTPLLGRALRGGAGVRTEEAVTSE